MSIQAPRNKQVNTCLYWLFPYFATVFAASWVTLDYFYMIPTGEYILKNGFPQINPFNAVEGMHIVIQNWVFCVAIYLRYLVGSTVSHVCPTASGFFSVMYVFISPCVEGKAKAKQDALRSRVAF